MRDIERVFYKLKRGNKFPGVLFIDETDELPNFKTFKRVGCALKFAEKVNGTIYTQVDTRAPWPNDVAYLRGLFHVNRTGIYAVAWW